MNIIFIYVSTFFLYYNVFRHFKTLTHLADALIQSDHIFYTL